jgi:heptosyltransferase II
MTPSITESILVVKNRAMGDSIIGLGSLQYLRELRPHAKIIYALPEWICPLYENVETAADEILPLRLNSIKDWWTFYRALKHKKIDTVYEMFQSGRTKKFFKLYSLLNRIPYLAHNHHTSKGPVHDQGKIKANIQRDLDGVWTFFGKTKSIPNFLNYTQEILVHSKSKNQIILGVVATRETKMWNLKRYSQLAFKIYEKNPLLKISIPLSPSAQDQAIKKKLISFGLPPSCHFLEVKLGRLPLELAGSKLYIGNDTGLKHLAIALGVKTLSFFGPEPPLEWHPYNKEKHPYFFLEDLECRTREGHYCGLSQCKTMDCLKIFSPEDVFNKISDLL